MEKWLWLLNSHPKPEYFQGKAKTPLLKTAKISCYQMSIENKINSDSEIITDSVHDPCQDA